MRRANATGIRFSLEGCDPRLKRWVGGIGVQIVSQEIAISQCIGSSFKWNCHSLKETFSKSLSKLFRTIYKLGIRWSRGHALRHKDIRSELIRHVCRKYEASNFPNRLDLTIIQ